MLADRAAFGLVTLRLGVIVALAVPSPLRSDRLSRCSGWVDSRLTSPDDPTIFGPLALAGVALNGVGWILLGLELATRSGRVREPAVAGTVSSVS